MINCKSLCKRLLFPPLWLLLPFTAAAIASLIAVFARRWSEDPIAVPAYVLSAYALTAVSVRIPRMIRAWQQFSSENTLFLRYRQDTRFRVRLILYLSLATNGIYAALQLGLGIYHGSAWYYSLAAYYLLLVVMRLSLSRELGGRQAARPDPTRDYRRYRFCGVMLVLMNATLGGIVLFMTRFGRGATHHPITTIALAAYTFTVMTVAIVDVIRYRKYKSPLYSAAKAISLAAACVSMLTLETAMLSAFGEEGDAYFRSVMTAATGTVVCVFVLGLGVYMILSAQKQLRKLRNENHE